MCCMSFLWSGATVTVVKHKSAILFRNANKWKKITNNRYSLKTHQLMSQAGCLIILLSHNGCLGNFFIYQAIRHHDLHLLYRCVIHLYVVLNADNFSKKHLHVGSVTIPRIIQSHLSLHSCSSPIWQCGRADILTGMMCIEKIFEEIR